MMGTSQNGNGDERDAFSRGSRRIVSFARGELQKLKRRFWKRQRAKTRDAGLSREPDGQ